MKIQFGLRRIVEFIEIENDQINTQFEGLDNNITKENLLKSGLWSYIRQKPLSKIPHFSTNPKSFYISGMPTEPFALNFEYIINNTDNYLQSGINALKTIIKSMKSY